MRLRSMLATHELHVMPDTFIKHFSRSSSAPACIRRIGNVTCRAAADPDGLAEPFATCGDFLLLPEGRAGDGGDSGSGTFSSSVGAWSSEIRTLKYFVWSG